MEENGCGIVMANYNTNLYLNIFFPPLFCAVSVYLFCYDALDLDKINVSSHYSI